MRRGSPTASDLCVTARASQEKNLISSNPRRGMQSAHRPRDIAAVTASQRYWIVIEAPACASPRFGSGPIR